MVSLEFLEFLELKFKSTLVDISENSFLNKNSILQTVPRILILDTPEINALDRVISV